MSDGPASRADRLSRLHAGILTCRACRLHESRTHAVPGEGDVLNRVMLIGEAPGEQEDLKGKPFVGRSGRFFDELLARHGFARRDVFITSSVKCRPPGNRDPKRDEWSTCGDQWLWRQVDLVNPVLIVLMGKIAIRQSLGETGPLRTVHGCIREQDGRRFLLTYHPTAGMRFPYARRAMDEDFTVAEAFLARGG